MAVAVLSIIAFSLSFQDIRGQNNLNNNVPGQNNVNQGFPTNSGVKSSDFSLNSGNLTPNINAQIQSNLPQTLSSSLGMPSFYSLQPQQNMQLLNQPQTSFHQPPFQQLNGGQSFLQQSLMPSTSVISQPNIQQASNAFVPNFSSYNYPQLPLSGHLVNMPSSISNPTSMFSSYPSISNCGCPQTGFAHNSGNYLGSVSSIPLVSERPQITSYSSLPYPSVISNPSFANNAVLQYQNEALGFLNHQIEDKLFIDDEESLDSDHITSLLLSLLTSPKKSPKVLTYPYVQGSKLSKSSQLKSLLPIILNLLKEKKERCSCDSICKCKRKIKKDKKGSEPQINTGYSKKKEYGILREEMFNNKSDEESPRVVREHKKYNRIRNTIPEESNESFENDDFYEDDK